MDKDVQEQLNVAIDEISAEYLEDSLNIFNSDSERRGHLFAAIKKNLTGWKRKRECVYRGCVEKSIKRSHTIQKSGPLKTISTDSHLMTSELDGSIGEVKLKRIGLADASVFPGFCNNHEKLFEEFENAKSTSGYKMWIMQLYRTVCREVVRKRFEIESFEKTLREYSEFRNERLKIQLDKKLGPNWLAENDVECKALNFYDDSITSVMVDTLADLKGILNILENEYLTPLEQEVKGKLSEDNQVFLIDLPAHIPVAISGMGTYCIDEEGVTKRILLILIVVPTEDKTKICIFARAADSEYLHAYVSSLTSGFSYLNMIEQWMVFGSDHWFTSEEVWRNKTEDEVSIVLEDILDSKRGITHELDYSIFDDVRKYIITEWESKPSLSDSEVAELEREKSKLAVGSV